MTTIENQFDDEPYDQPPDPNKEYWCSQYTISTGFTHLMKRVLLSNKIPLVLTNKDINEIDQQNTYGWTALMIACKNSNAVSNQETVGALIKVGADLDITDNDGWTALMHACRNSNTTSKQETVEALIKAGADLNITDDYGWTALMFSSYSNTDHKQETVKTLIKAGADLNMTTSDGSTALILACYKFNTNNKQETVGALIKAGAELCYDYIIRLKSNDIYETIIDRYQYDPTKIEPILDHISQELKGKYDYYQQCVTNIKSIVDNQLEIYYQPNNIGALLCQTNFEFKRNINYCSNKLLFLFAKN